MSRKALDMQFSIHGHDAISQFYFAVLGSYLKDKESRMMPRIIIGRHSI